MASDAPTVPASVPVVPPTEFPGFQAMPMEVQCMVWGEMPLEASFLPFEYHAYPTKAEEDSPRGLYRNFSLAFRQKVMKLCKSAWLTYSLSHQLYHVLQQGDGALFSVTKSRLFPSQHPITYGTIRLNLKSDVLSRQYELIRRQNTAPGNRDLMYAQADVPLGTLTQTRTPTLPEIAGGRELVPYQHTPENSNLVRHVHVDILIRRPGSTPTVILDHDEEPISTETFLVNTVMVPKASSTNLQTITLSLHGPGALHKVLRLVKLHPPPSTPTPTTTAPPLAILPAPAKYHNIPQSSVGWSNTEISNTIRTDGALVITPLHILRNQTFALFRVITPLGDEITTTSTFAESNRPLETFHNDPVQWRAALQLGVNSQNGLMGPHQSTTHQLHVNLIRRIQYVLETGRGANHLDEFEMDGLCGPNYAMEEAKVFR